MTPNVILKRLPLLVIFLTGIYSIALAQSADFTADVKGGCSPLKVSFTNSSTGVSAGASYSWELGNGNQSKLVNPSTTYTDEKTYTVKLTVTDAGKIYTKTMDITVYKKPQVDFKADLTKGCLPLPVTFTSTSTPGDGTISNYFWEFGDGVTEPAGQQSQQHTYNIAQTVTAGLTVRNSYGCTNTVTKNAILKVLPSVKADFSTQQNVLCRVTDEAKFKNSSTGAGTLTYTWDFGDGKNSSDENPAHVYNAKGVYTVKLTVKSSDGCTAEMVKDQVLNVANFKSDFDVPALICQNNEAVFNDKSNPITNTQSWYMDGQSYYYTSPRFPVTLNDGNPHKIQLINNYGSCYDTATKTVTAKASPKLEGFVIDLQGSCGSPITVKFKDTTKGAVKWAWDFDGYYSGFTPTSYDQSTSFNYTSDNTYYPELEVTNADGCSSRIYKVLPIYKTNAYISSSNGYIGCETFTSTFTAGADIEIKEYNWTFSDGGKSTAANPTYTFRKPGNYLVTLNYTNANGCKGSTNYSVSVYERPKFDFTASPGTTVCGNNPVQFIVTGTNTAGTFYWDFGDNNYYDIYNTHYYYKDSTFTVTLVIQNQGCRDTVTKKNYITVLPPFPKIATALNTCDGTRGLVTFTETSQKTNAWSWDFGDGSAAESYTTAKSEIKHTYTKTGKYKVVLTATNGSCSVRDSSTVYVLLKQKPVLSATQTQACANDELALTISQFETNPYDYYSGYYGYGIAKKLYGDGSEFNGQIYSSDYYWNTTYHFTVRNLEQGKKDLQFTTQSNYFQCYDTTNILPLRINGPVAGFEIPKNELCFKDPAAFKDTSYGMNNVPIVKWAWSYGDGQSETLTTGKDVVQHRYSDPGFFYVTLTVTDKDGCSASTPSYQYVSVKGPKAALSLSANPVLPNTTVYFSNNSNLSGTDYYSNKFTWQYSGITKTTSDYGEYIYHNYTETGTDTIRLIASNGDNTCIDTAVQYLQIKNINLAYSYTTSYIYPETGCPPVVASFVNKSINTSSISWDFGDGSTAGNSDYASHTYTYPGLYKVTLYGYLSDGTIDSAYDFITVKGPFATIKTDKLFTCGAEDVTLHAENYSNTNAYSWDFGDGTVVETRDTFAVHQYLTPGVYTPTLVPKDNSGCPAQTSVLPERIVIDTLHAGITHKPEIICDSATVFFLPELVSVAKDQLQQPIIYHWNFGTGNPQDTSASEAPVIEYNNTGSYIVSLKTSSPYGCVDETQLTVLVKPTARGVITGPSTICQDDKGLFTASASVVSDKLQWEWHFQNNSIINGQNPAAQPFNNPGTDAVMLVINNEGCYDTTIHTIVVNARPVIDISPRQPHVCIGDSVQLIAHDGEKYTWLPAANIDNAFVSNPLVYPVINTTYAVEVKNRFECVSRDSVLVLVTQRFKTVVDSPVHLCKGSTLVLKASGADKYTWLDGTDLDDIHSATPVTHTTVPRFYTVVGYDSYRCFADTAHTEIKIDPLPTVNAGPDVITLAGAELNLNATGSGDIVSWNWQPATYLSCSNCASPKSNPRSDITYVVEVATDHNCKAKDSLSIHLVCKASQFNVPSSFTPNGDMLNDYFQINGKGIKLIKHFIIFGRWGEKVFEKTNMPPNNRSAAWDGTYRNQPLVTGTYVFMVEVICDTGESFSYKGTVTLIR